jgi:HEAT repeat protein
LLEALNDRDSFVRSSAADALGKIGSEAAVRTAASFEL